ncbi:hypothetical protein QTG54_010131 [Skeletonema marinoi]|uniref:Uncharacterized protein n=1 Tax=Skeletonema marinoi TaxID=267567 RepID=A0AAD8Y539_9STRA|nr:hypothetical protein QTG54_010131 [Skeletonema marinoi]
MTGNADDLLKGMLGISMATTKSPSAANNETTTPPKSSNKGTKKVEKVVMNENHPPAVQPMPIIIIHLPRARQHVQVVKDGVVAVPARKKIPPPPQIMMSRTRLIKEEEKD